MSELIETPLAALHARLEAKMVGFAGYSLPVQYPMGVMQEHLHTRARAGLFDVSHMGQIEITGASWEDVALAFEALVPQDVLGLADGRQRYGFLTNDQGGIEDDLMFARRGETLFLVVNGACKHADLERIRAGLPTGVSAHLDEARALIALQGPVAGSVIATLDAQAAEMRFMEARMLSLCGHAVWASRSGYTGEDGFEISVAADEAEALAARLIEDADVAPVGLGARDSLRLEAGLCLYGNDIDAQTDPVSAGLSWAIQPVRRPGGGRAGSFPGAEDIFDRLTNGPERRRVGLMPAGRAPMRAGVALFSEPDAQTSVGTVTSGGFGPSVGSPVAMGYVASDHAGIGTRLWGEVRGKRLEVTVEKLPFVPKGYRTG